MKESLINSQRVHVKQIFEAFELLGFETRNKYHILDQNQSMMGFAAEVNDGAWGFLARNFFGHWRSFKIIIFDNSRRPIYELHFPFRWFFKTLYISDANGKRLGHLEQRFSILRKKFDVFDTYGKLVAQINSSLFRFWTFEFHFRSKKLGTVQKKWSGLMNEAFTDRDNFTVSFADRDLSEETKAIMLSTCLMVDIIYFEKKGSGSNFGFGN